MSRPEDRRTSARILSEFPVVLLDDKGVVLDPHAVAHDVSDKGFKIETRAVLKSGQPVRFSLSLDAEGDVKGRARIVWCEPTDLSFWGGVQFQRMSWSDKRRVRRITSPSGMDWNALADKAILALSILLVTLVGWRLLSSSMWRGILGGLVPTGIAALALGWALVVLLRRR
jgi:hypothetical protein